MRIDRSYVGAVALSGIVNAAVSGLATALLLPTLIAKIGLAAYGSWAMLGMFQAVASLLEIGMSKAIVYYVPRAPSAQWLILRRAAGYVGGTSLLFGLLALSLHNLGPLLLGAAGARDPYLASWILIAGSAIAVVSTFTTLCRAVLEARGRAHIVNFYFAVLTTLQYGVALAISTFSNDTRFLICGTVAVYVAMLIVHALLVMRLPTLTPTPEEDATPRLSMARIGMRAFGAELPLIVTGSMTLYLFARVSPVAADYGVLDLAIRISALGASVLGFVGVPFFAGAARAAAGTMEDRACVRARALWFTRLLLGLAVVGCAIFALIGRPLLGMLFHERVDDIYVSTAVLLAGTTLLAALEPVSRLEMGMGRLGRLFAARSMLPVVTMASLAALATASPLSRFSTSLALGFTAASFSIMALALIERARAGK